MRATIAGEAKEIIRLVSTCAHGERGRCLAVDCETCNINALAALTAAATKAAIEVLEKSAKHRCRKCRNGTAFAEGNHGVFRPRGHTGSGVVGDNPEWCQADWEHEQIAAIRAKGGPPCA